MSTLGHERVGTAGLSVTMAADLRAIVSLARTYNPDALRDPALGIASDGPTPRSS